MTRENIFKILNQEYNISSEMNKIVQILSRELINYSNGLFEENYTIEELFDSRIISNWKQRGMCISSQEIKTKLKIPKKFYEDSPFEDIIKTLEYYVNLIYLINTKLGERYSACDNFFDLLVQNINFILDKISYEDRVFEKDEKVILIPKNPTAIAVAEISPEDTALAIFMYHHTSLKGDLEEKKKLLYQISLEYEPLLKAPIEGYKDFFDKANALLNNLHIRHNNKTKENNKNKIIEINDIELEKWYDELYQLLLFCVLIKDNLERRNKIDEFLKSIKGVNI